MKKKWINLLCLVLVSATCHAQKAGFKFYADLSPATTDGFYNIRITPAIAAHINTDYTDVRIVNKDGKWIPHLLSVPSLTLTSHNVDMDLKFEVVENNRQNSVLVITALDNSTNNISLKIRNTVAQRFCSISGSDDKLSWYVINDSVRINPVPVESATTNIFTLNFPSSNYLYFKIAIHNYNHDPYDIQAITKSTAAENTHIEMEKATANPEATIVQKDSGKISYITITENASYQFDRINVLARGVKYFQRKAELYIDGDASKKEGPQKLISAFQISNNSTLSFPLPITKSKIIYLKIFNEDNLPLLIEKVTTSLKPHFLTTYLDKGDGYQLIMDNATARAPNYDLSNFDKNIPKLIPELQSKEIAASAINTGTTNEIKNNKLILWITIIAALCLLLFFTKKMLTEVDKKKKDDII